MSEVTKWTGYSEKGRRNLFYFTSAEHGISNLENKRVKISNFDRCNDVFELASFSMKSPSSRQKHRSWMKDISGKYGLVCLSKRWRNPLMWAHYADRGQGMCMVFSVKESDFETVTYIPDRKVRGSNFEFPTPADQPSFKAFCATKFSAWKYEQEARVFCALNDQKRVQSDSGLHFLRVDSSFKLIGVINGPRPSVGKSRIMKAAEGQIKFFQCRPAFTKFHLVSQRKSELWHQ